MKRIETLKTMLVDSPNDSFLRFAIAKEYEKSEDFTAALEYYQWIVDHDPEYVGAYYHMASVYTGINEVEKAIEKYDEGIRVAKKLADFHSLNELVSAKQNLDLEL